MLQKIDWPHHALRSSQRRLSGRSPRGDRGRAERIWHYHSLQLGDGALRAALPELRGRSVACWCRRSDQPWHSGNLCHLDIIAVWLDYFSDATMQWLGGHDLAVGWEEELDERVRALLKEG